MSIKMKSKLLPIIILFSTLFILMFGTVSNADITIKFENVGKTYTKSDSEWLALTEPTVVETDDSGNWYIVWAITDPPKTNKIHYTTTAYRIHTKPASGSGNTANNTDRNKLKNYYNKYGVDSLMGTSIEIKVDSSQLDTKEYVKIGDNNYFFRLLKLTPDNINTLFPSGYKSGDKLYFSGVMKNILGYSTSTPTTNLRTYLQWSSSGMHTVVFSELTRNYVNFDGYLTHGSWGDVDPNKKSPNIFDKIGIKYIAAIQGHYDREIILDKVEIVKEYNATLEIWKSELDSNGNPMAYKKDDTKTLTFTNLQDGTTLIANDDNNKVSFMNLASTDKLESRSPIVEKYKFIEAKVEGTNYVLGSEEKINGKDLVIRFYYEKEPEKVENNIYIYKVQKDTGSNFKDTSNQLDKTIQRVGEPDTSKGETIPQKITANGTGYQFYKVSTYYGEETTPYNSTGSYIGTYTYNVGPEKIDTHVVIEYFTVVDDPEEEHYQEPYTDQSLDGSARGHILSDKANNSTGREYNVLNGIPTSQSVYSFAQANGFIYKVEGNRRYGKKNFDVVVCTFYQNEDGWWDIKYDYDSQPQEQGTYEYYTIEKYDIAKIQGARIEHSILTSSGGYNVWDSNATLDINIDNIASGTEYFEHAVISNADEKSLDEEIEFYNNANASIADELNADKGEDEEKIVAPQISYLNGKTTGWSSYYTSNTTKSDAIIYIIASEDSTKDSISESAKNAIKNQVSYNNDRIEINYYDGEDPKPKKCQINPAGELSYLTYDPVGDLNLDELQGSYENLESGNFWDKWRGTLFGDIAAGFFDLLDGAVEAIESACNKVIEKYQDRDTLKERLDEVDPLDIAKRWDVFIQWWREEKMKEMQEAIDKYNETAKAINEIPRAVPKENFYKDNQIIEATLPNGIYSSPEDSCKVTYVRVNGIGCTTLIEDSYMTQLMNGIYALADESSYQDNKTCLLPYQTDIGWELTEAFEEVYTAAEIAYDLEYIIQGEVNDVIVHTPVVVSAKLVGGSDFTQYMGSTSEVSPEGLDVSYVKIGEEYTIDLTCEGVHRPIIGYGQNENNLLNTNYKSDYSMFVKDNKIAIRFPYDIEVNTGAGYKLYKAYEWYDFETSISSIKIRIPDWAEVEGNNGVAYFDIRVSAINDTSYDTEEMGWLKANMDNVNKYRKIYTDSPKDYRAHYSIPVKAIGKVYDFRVNFTIDPEYLLTYTSGKMKDGQIGYLADGFSIKNLPIGKTGTNPSNVTYTKAPKLGNKFKFNLKTLGWKTNNIQITPTFYFVPKNGGAPDKVDVYYQSENTGKYTKLTGTCDYSINTTLPTVSTQIPNSTQKITEAGPNSAKVTATNKVKDAYAHNQLSQFVPVDLDRVTSSKKTNIGNLGGINLTEEERFRLPESNDLKEMASNSIWYGEYKLPSTSKFVKEGKSFTEANILTKAKDGDGYILVCFNIVGKYEGNNYLSYQKEVESGKTQWNKEGYTKTVQLVNGQTYNLPGSSTDHVGVFLYEAFENNGEDVVNPH